MSIKVTQAWNGVEQFLEQGGGIKLFEQSSVPEKGR